MSSGNHSVDFVRKGLIVAVLFAGLMLLYRYAVPASDPDPTGLLALGFVILAAFTIGELVEVIKLPHITGYLLAGLVLGPSISHTFHLHLPPPFDVGVLNENVIGQLGILDTLALPLICLTAGGALDIGEIRKAIRPILGILVGQTVLIFAGCIGLVVLISGMVVDLSWLSMPQLAGLSPTAIFALGAVVASVSLATSDAATIAIVVSTRARGPLTTNALSVAVLKDVLVVICFSASTAVALSALPTGAEASFTDSLIGIGLSIVMGLALGGGIHVYLKYINAEILLFLVGMIYTMSFIADQLNAESALMFIVAGFVAANYSPFGEKLIKEVERLSTPVFVVFFTLAGAKLHLDVLASMAGLAFALVGVRAAALYVGCRVGAIVGGADPMSKKYVWMSYLSQAGLAITLANGMRETYGESIGGALFSFILAGVAIHELIGPAALQFALDRAGEIPHGPEDAEHTPEEAAAPAPTEERWRPSPSVVDDPWGAPPDLLATELAAEVVALEAAVRAEVARVIEGPLARQRRSAEQHLRDLRKSFLEEHRAISAARRRGEPLAGASEEALRRLAEQWRQLSGARASGIEARAWDPQAFVVAVDRLAEQATAAVRIPIEPETLELRDEGRVWRLRRRLLRSSRRVRAPQRTISLRDLSRYHLCGQTPARLEAVAAAMVNAELRIAEEVGAIFTEAVTDLTQAPQGLDEVRRQVDARLGALSAELTERYDRGADAMNAALGQALRAIKSELRELGTLDLPGRSRRYGRVFSERNRGQKILREHFREARETAAAHYATLQLRLELYGFTARAHRASTEHARELEERISREGVGPMAAVEERLGAALQDGAALILADALGSELIARLRERAGPVMAQVDAAAASAAALQVSMRDAGAVQALVEVLREQAQQLTARYILPAAEVTITDPGQLVVVERTAVPLRKLVVKALDTDASRRLLSVSQKLGEDLGAAARQLDELEQIIPFNIDLACAELEVYTDAPLPEETRSMVEEMLLGALGRSHARVQRLCEDAVSWPSDARHAVIEAVDAELAAMMALLRPGELAELRQVMRRDDAMGRSLARRAEELGGVLSQTRQQLAVFAQRAIGPDRLTDIRHRAGLSVDDSIPLRIALQPPGDVCPTVYRRLFTGKSSAAELMIGRDSELARLRAIFLDGGLRAAAVIGPKGAGSSSLTALAARGQGATLRLTFSAPATAADVGRFFEESHEGIVLIDGIHWLFSAAPGGSAPLRRLVEGIVADQGRRAWLLSADELVWDHACCLEPLAEAFPTIVRLGAMSPGTLQQALLTR
ncbi:MAG: Kef-type K+ transport system membrane component KefB, partial [Myxococcota bacterium]